MQRLPEMKKRKPGKEPTPSPVSALKIPVKVAPCKVGELAGEFWDWLGRNKPGELEPALKEQGEKLGVRDLIKLAAVYERWANQLRCVAAMTLGRLEDQNSRLKRN